MTIGDRGQFAKHNSASKRVRRGLSRIGLIGLIPAVIFAVGYLVKEKFTPSGALFFRTDTLQHLANVPTFDLMPFSAMPWIKSNPKVDVYAVERSLNDRLDKSGVDFHLIDGRTIRAIIPSLEKRTRAELETSVNRSIIAYEMLNQNAINRYTGPFYAGTMLFNCPAYSSCDAPFPNRSKAHLDRKFEFVGAILAVIAGLAWYFLLWTFGWVIAGFMKE